MKKAILLSMVLFLGYFGFTQTNKKVLTFDDILKWNRITEKSISNDGNIIVYKVEPWKGDPVLKIKNNSGKEIKSINCGTNGKISNNSQTVVFKIKPKEELVRELKLKKTKKEDMPEDSIGIFNINKNSIIKYEKLKSYKIPEKFTV